MLKKQTKPKCKIDSFVMGVMCQAQRLPAGLLSLSTIASYLTFVVHDNGLLTIRELLSVQTTWMCLYPSGTLNHDHFLFLLPTSCLLVFITAPCHSSFLNTHMLFLQNHLGFPLSPPFPVTS